jgi:hypothetical protein
VLLLFSFLFLVRLELSAELLGEIDACGDSRGALTLAVPWGILY